MLEETSGITDDDRIERLAYHLHQGLAGTSLRLRRDALDLGETLLYEVKVRRVGRQVERFAEPAVSIDSLPLSLL